MVRLPMNQATHEASNPVKFSENQRVYAGRGSLGTLSKSKAGGPPRSSILWDSTSKQLVDVESPSCMKRAYRNRLPCLCWVTYIFESTFLFEL